MHGLQRLILISIILILTGTGQSTAQFYSVGQDPASVEWKQYKTENFQVIFPAGYEQQAAYIADVLHWSYENTTHSLEHKPRKISVIIHNQTIQSNGFVSWAPKRLELYTTPPADNEHHDWMEGLVIHEYRHVVQVDKLNQGVTRLLGILFGEMGLGAVVSRIPVWFLEGDAVAAETEFTRAGRGRLPGFEQGLRAQVLTRGLYSFDKAFLGSYKDYVPDYYELGYQLVASAKAQHGATAWSPVINNVARRPYAPFPFSRGMKKTMGTTITQHYRNTFSWLDSLWRYQSNQKTYTPATPLNTTNRLYTSYQYPQWLNDTTVVALKSGLRDINSFVTINRQGNEELLFYPGSVLTNSVNAAAGKLVWAEYIPDPRWAHRSFGEIMVYDFKSDTIYQLTTRGKYFSPALSPDGAKIAAVEISPDSKNALVILDASTGEETWRFAYPANDLIMQPAWHNEDNRIAVIVLDDKGKRLDEIAPETNETRTLLVATDADISSPVYLGDDVLINGTWSGINNIYRVNRNGKVFLAVSSEFGAVNAAVKNEEIIYSDYTADGYKLMLVESNNSGAIPLEEVKDHSPQLYRQYLQPQGLVAGSEVIPRQVHQAKPYRRLTNLFHLHSWFPAFMDIDNLDVTPGLSLLFQNKLSTSFANLGYQWDRNDQTGKYTAKYTYRGWYPVTEIIAETGDRRFYYSLEGRPRNFLFKEDVFKLALSIPQNFQRREYILGYTPSFRFGITRTGAGSNTPDSIQATPTRFIKIGQTAHYIHEYRLFAYRQRRTVARDIYPRQGQVIDLNYRHSPWGEFNMGHVVAARAILYLPGIIRHQGIRLTGAIQQRKIADNESAPGIYNIIYSFGNLIPYPRGIIGHSHQELATATIDYALPLLYPDLAIPSLVYVKRVRMNLFYDYAHGKRFPPVNSNAPAIRESLYSYGLGLTADTHVFRFIAPVALGVQVAFPKGQSPDFQFLYSVRF